MFEEEDLLKPVSAEALCVVLCTDELKYIDPDSHYLHIPKNLFVKYTTKLNLSKIVWELYDPTILSGKKIYLKKIEPAQGEFKTNILVPNWVQNTLGIKMCGNQLAIRPVPRPQQIKRCKIRGNTSSYIHMDIKTLLEDKINQFKCVNLGTIFSINKVSFTIVELVNTHDKLVEWGIVSEELEIDFDTPDDIKLIEKRKSLMDKINLKIEDKINSINKQKNDINKKKTGILKFSDFVDSQNKLSNLEKEQVNWDELKEKIIKDLKLEHQNDINSTNPTNSTNFINFNELELKIKLLEELIENAKDVQNKIIEENKKKLLDELELNKSNKPNEKNESKQINNTDVFNTKAYKLNDDKVEGTEEVKKDEKLTMEEIRKARLNRFNKLN